MRMLKIIIITILISFLLIPVIVYTYNKTIGKGQKDCMIEYINNYYPHGCTYIINGDLPHIDKCNNGNEYMKETSKVEGCIIKDSFQSAIFNIPYCYTTLLFENIFTFK